MFPIPGNPLQVIFSGPYVVKSREKNSNHVVNTPNRKKKTQFCHVNMLKKYVERENSPKFEPVSATSQK